MLSAAQKSFIQHTLMVEWDIPAARKAQRAGELMTDAQFADFLHLSPDALKYWKKMPEFRAALDKARERLENSKDYFLECMRYRADEELWKMYLKASGSEKRHFLNMVYDRTKDVGITGESVDYGELTDDELLDLMVKRDVAPVGLSPDELRILENKRSKSLAGDGSVPIPPHHVKQSHKGVADVPHT